MDAKPGLTFKEKAAAMIKKRREKQVLAQAKNAVRKAFIECWQTTHHYVE